MRFAIVRIQVAIPVPKEATEDEVLRVIENFELPPNYVTNSFDFVKEVEAEYLEEIEYGGE
jgi:hypothetical protein